MLESFKKGLFCGVGLLSVSQEKIEGFIDEYVKKGEVKMEEKPEVVKKVIEDIKNYQGKLEETINQKVEKVITRLNLATKDDIQKILDKLDEKF